MVDILIPRPPDPPVGYVPNAGGAPASALVAAFLSMPAADIRQVILNGGGVVQVTRALTASEINTLASVPIVVVSATGLPVGAIITPVFWTLEQRLGAITFSAAPTLTVRYAGVAVNAAGSDGISNVANEYRYGTHVIASSGFGVGVSVKNTDLVLTATADTTGGSGTFLFNLGYQIMAGPGL